MKSKLAAIVCVSFGLLWSTLCFLALWFNGPGIASYLRGY